MNWIQNEMDDDFTPVQNGNKTKELWNRRLHFLNGIFINFLLFNLFNLEQRIDERKKNTWRLFVLDFSGAFFTVTVFYDSWDGCMYFVPLKPETIIFYGPFKYIISKFTAYHHHRRLGTFIVFKFPFNIKSFGHFPWFCNGRHSEEGL